MGVEIETTFVDVGSNEAGGDDGGDKDKEDASVEGEVEGATAKVVGGPCEGGREDK